MGQDSPEVPSLIKFIASNEVAGFASMNDSCGLNNQFQINGFQPICSSSRESITPGTLRQNEASQPVNSHLMSAISISTPSSPSEVHLQNPKSSLFCGHGETMLSNGILDSFAISKTATTRLPKQAKFHSQTMPTGSMYPEGITGDKFPNQTELQAKNPSIERSNDERFNSFKSWHGKLGRQLSNLCGKPHESDTKKNLEIGILPVDRYFDALEGPELDTLKASEESVLPEDEEWPFLLRYPISSFGICLGISSQAIMWKSLATSPSMSFLHVSPNVNLSLWCISAVLIVVVSFIYLLKVIFYFKAVSREYYHPIRVNFFFAPWIAFLFLAVGVPPSFSEHLPPALWFILMTPVLCLELKIYGQWMSGGQRRLSKVANPCNHLAIVGNFVVASLGTSVGLKEGPIFFFAIGLAHYIVVFVTLYQRLTTNEALPKELHPVFFLFVAAPSEASIAWTKIRGSFDYGSRIVCFIALFRYFSLAVRVKFFRGFRFSLSWWAYTFPMTGAATAAIKYSNEVTNIITRCLSITLCAVATSTVAALLIKTILHAFVRQDLFPNDIAIAISEKRRRKGSHLRSGTSDTKDIENHLKFGSPEHMGIEASLKLPSCKPEEV